MRVIRHLVILCSLCAVFTLYVSAEIQTDQAPTLEELLEKIDSMYPWNISDFDAVMYVHRSDTDTEFTIERSIIVGETILVARDADDGLVRLRYADEVVSIQPDGHRVFILESHMNFLDFLSSDLSYYELLANNRLDQWYDFKELERHDFNDTEVYRIRGRYRGSSADMVPYYERVLLIDIDSGLLVAEHAYNNQGERIRSISYSDYRGNQEDSNLQLPHRIDAVNHHRQHSSTMLEIAYPDDVFIDTEQQAALPNL